MRKDDIERMISLADDRYIEEMFAEKFRGGRKNIFLTFAAVAAGLALFAGGIGYFVSRAENNNDIITEPPAVSMENTEYNEHNETEPVKVPVNYSDFFKNIGGEYPPRFTIDWDNEFNGDEQIAFSETYVKTILPFSAEGYSETRDQFYVYVDKDGNPFAAGIYFESPFDENASPKFKSISVNVCDKGKLLHPFPLEDFEPVNYMYTDIYGFDDIDNSYNSDVYESRLKAYFTAGDNEYSVSTSNLSAEETMHIVESLIESGFSAKDFDMTMGGEFEHETVTLNFDTANSTAPFAGYVPVVDGLFYLYNDGVIYSTEKVNGELFSQYMAVTYYDGTEGDGKRVMLEYYTSNWTNKKPFDNVTYPMSVSKDQVGSFLTDGEYKFTIECGGFNINVTAKCSHDELWTYIEAIKNSAGEGIPLPEITLEEANNIAPFAGYIPQSENIGEMTLNGVSYDDGSADGENNILVSYSQDVPDKYILLYYETFRKGVDPIPLSEVYSRLDSLAEPSTAKDGGADCKHYGFAIDCGEFIIKVSADCTPEEMIKCIMGINGLTDYSDGEEATKQFNLSQANMEEPYAGYVPQCMTIGSMSLSNVYVSNHVMQVEGYGYTANMDMFKTISVFYKTDQQANPQKYISLNYVAAAPTSVTVVAFADCLNQLESLAQPSNQGNFDCRYYDFYINCGDFCIQVGGECTPGEMETCIRGILDSKDYTQYNITKFSLDEARGNELTAGYVPITDKIGDMSLENGVCQLYEIDGSQYIIVKYSNPTFKYDDERFNYYGKYLTAKYVKKEVSEEGVTVLDEIEVAPTIDLNDNGVGKYKFTLDCGDIYIRVEALCYYTEMWEFLKELKSVN